MTNMMHHPSIERATFLAGLGDARLGLRFAATMLEQNGLTAAAEIVRDDIGKVEAAAQGPEAYSEALAVRRARFEAQKIAAGRRTV